MMIGKSLPFFQFKYDINFLLNSMLVEVCCLIVMQRIYDEILSPVYSRLGDCAKRVAKGSIQNKDKKELQTMPA
jgi:hypothetical protein